VLGSRGAICSRRKFGASLALLVRMHTPGVLCMWAAASVSLHTVGYQIASNSKGPLSSDGGPRIFGHWLATSASTVVLGYLGTRAWFFSGVEPSDRVGGYNEVGALICAGTIAHQGYDAIVTMLTPILQGPTGEFLVHHVVATLVAVLALATQSFHFYLIYFFGVTEVSSILFQSVELFRSLPSLRKGYDTANSVVREAFAYLFLPIRFLYWPVVVYRAIGDSIDETQGLHNAQRPAKSSALVGTFVVVLAFMTLLQTYWGLKIIRSAIKKFSGDMSYKED